MSVDAEIVRVRHAIQKVHSTIFGLTSGIQNITNKIDHQLDGFTSQVQEVVGEFSNVRAGVSHITNKFPSRPAYLGVLLAIDLLVWILAAVLLYRIIQSCRHGVKNSDQIIAEYEQLVHHPELMDIHVHLSKDRRPPTARPTAVVVDRRGQSTLLNVGSRRSDHRVFDRQFGVSSEPLLQSNFPEQFSPPIREL